MNDRFLKSLWLSAAATVVVTAAAVWMVRARVALGILSGGACNLVSLWCLAHLLGAWLGPQPSRRRVLGWFLLKFPLLYLFVFSLPRASYISLIGFGIGFTVVLIVAMGGFAFHTQRMAMNRPYGR